MPRGKIRYNRLPLHRHRCKVCGELFDCVRSDAVVCSARCRQNRKRFLATLEGIDALQARIDKAKREGKLALAAMLHGCKGR